MSAPLALYAVAAPGLESFTAGELARLGLQPGPAEPGGVPFAGSLPDLARANLWLRTASRVLLRVTSFHARALGELERKAGTVPWDRWLRPGEGVAFRVTTRKSRLYHHGAIAQRLAAAAQRVAGAVSAGGTPDDDETDSPGAAAQLVVVRLLRDQCLVSLDSSGEHLHRRGYRQALGRAPLRETLAAGLVAASGWDGTAPLVDPFAGSGTIPIEAALLARRRPPGRARDFGFRRWPEWRDEWWRALLAEADAQERPRAPGPIVAADRDAGAAALAGTNAARAGVAGDVEVRCASLSALAPPPGRGHLVSNPPYGVRVRSSRDLRDLYARLGQVARRSLAGWTVSLLVPAAPLERATGLGFEERFRARNGGIPVRAVRATVPLAADQPVR